MAKENGKAQGSGAYELILQPGAGIKPLLTAIDDARERIEVVIFRFDKPEVEEALIAAVKRGVPVQALIANTNRGGERNLRGLETRLLAGGVTVARTADDLARYHGKMMIVDRKMLYVLAFNFTALDIDRSRSFGIATSSPALVAEAVKLFEADCRRLPYEPAHGALLVSPINAREELSEFLSAARKELLIYDPCVGDPRMVRLLEERSRAGVKIRLIGRLKRGGDTIDVRPLAPMRLHTRTIIRDRVAAFVGSQSLRTIELDGRREIGLFVEDRAILSTLCRVFESDWSVGGTAVAPALSSDKLAKKVAKAISKELPPVAEVIESVAAELPSHAVTTEGIDLETLEESIRNAVKTVVKDAIQEVAGKAQAVP